MEVGLGQDKPILTRYTTPKIIMNNYGWGRMRPLCYRLPFRGSIYTLSQVHLRPPIGHRPGDNMPCLFLPCGVQGMELDRTTILNLYNPFLFAHLKNVLILEK